MTASINSFRLN